MTDLRQNSDGTWTLSPLLVDDEALDDIKETLKRKGWRSFFKVGSPYSLEILVWRRGNSDSRFTEYALQIGGPDEFSEYVVVEGMPAMMALLGEWTPTVTAAEITRALDDLSNPRPWPGGIVESVVTRIKGHK